MQGKREKLRLLCMPKNDSGGAVREDRSTGRRRLSVRDSPVPGRCGGVWQETLHTLWLLLPVPLAATFYSASMASSILGSSYEAESGSVCLSVVGLSHAP